MPRKLLVLPEQSFGPSKHHYDQRAELPLLVWFRTDHKPLIVSGLPKQRYVRAGRRP